MGLPTTTADEIEGEASSNEKAIEEKETTDININKEKSTIECSVNVKATSGMNATMERLLMQCSACEENYNDERVPRNLSCGHSLCTDCANECLSSQKRCPECRELQQAKTASDLPINYPLRRLVRAVTDEEINLKDIVVPEVPVHIPNCDIYQDAGECPVHSSPLVFLCVSCSMWVCQDCLVVDHPYLPRGSCRIVSLKEAMEEIRKEHRRNTDSANSDIDYILKNLDSLMEKHNRCLKFDVCGDIRSHLRLIQEIQRGFDEIKKEDNLTAEKAKRQLEKLSEMANKTTSPEEITSSCKDLLECMANIKKYISLEKERKITVLQDISTHLRMDLKLLVTQKVPVYAVLQDKGKVRHAPITASSDDRLLLCSLREETLPKESILIPYEYILELIPEENQTIFFEVGTSDESLGVVFVRLFGDTLRTRQAHLLCTGEKGPCYRNTRFYEYDEKECALKGGDYMNNDGTGGQAILPGVEEVYSSSATGAKGYFAAHNELYSQFLIYLKDNGSYVLNVIGEVTKGLEVLIATSEIKPITNCVIRDCGIFIPMRDKNGT